MRRWARPLVVLATAAAGAAAIVAVTALNGGRASLAPPSGEPLSYDAAVVPERVLFGDRVLAELRVTIDRNRLDPAAVKPVPVFTPFRRVGSIGAAREDFGDTTILTWRYPLQCIDRACASHSGQEITLPSGLLRYVPRHGAGVSIPLSFQSVFVGSRLSPAVQQQIAATPQALDLSPDRDPLPRLGFRASPTVLSWLFSGAAAAIVLGLAAALCWRVWPRGGAVPVVSPSLPPFDAALLALERSFGGSEAERRVALDALAHELDGVQSWDLAGESRRLAWSQGGPDPAPAAAVLERARVLAGTAVRASA